MSKKNKRVEWTCQGFLGYKTNTIADQHRRREQRAMQLEGQLVYKQLKEMGWL